MTRAVCLGLAALGAACSRPVATARTTAIEPAAAAELEAEVAIAHRACSPSLGWLLPGAGQLCLRKTGEGAAILGLAAAEAGTAIAVGLETGDGAHPGVVLPLTGLQDLWVYGLADAAITGDLAQRKRFAPRDTLADLVAAPLNAEVMKRPAVWGGILATLAVGLGASLALSGGADSDRLGEDPNLFGHQVPGEIGYPLAGATAGALFTHVAIAEEALFRGVIQSGLARAAGETGGWLAGSLVFGLAHAPNALALEGDERRDYLVYGIPVTTAAGAYLGWLYRESGYSMAPPVALHFWYDFLLTATLLALEPQDSIFAARIAIPF